MLRSALELPGPSTLRVPKTTPRHVDPDDVGRGLDARQLRVGDGSVCLLGVGKTVGACLSAADELAAEGMEATVWDVRVVSPPDVVMLDDAMRHRLVVTAEDGVRHGGAGHSRPVCRSPPDGSSASHASTWPRGRRTTFSPASASMVPASPRPSVGSGSVSRSNPTPTERRPPSTALGRARPSWRRSGGRSRSPRSTPRSTPRRRPRSPLVRRAPFDPSRRSGCSRP